MTLLTIAKKYKIRVTKKNKFGKRVSRTQREILKDIQISESVSDTTTKCRSSNPLPQNRNQ